MISAAFTINPRTIPVLEGSVQPQDLAWSVTGLDPGDLFFRQLKFAEFDVSELSMSSLAIGTARGDRTWLALPIFTTRDFYHSEIIVRDDSPLTNAADLRGKRVGVLEYQQTSVVWIRTILEHEFGVNATEMEWFQERAPAKSHGGATGFTPPPGVHLSYVAPESSLAQMLADGELDAILFLPPEGGPGDLDFKPGARAHLRSRTLYADPVAEARRYARATGIVPLNHGVVIRRSLAETDPSLASKVFALFQAANPPGAYLHGVRANRTALEALLRALADQHLTDRVVTIEELFVAESLDW